MAKGRVINKSISTSNKVNLGLRNPLDCLLYTWGLCHADDEGRIDGHATIYRATVAPALPGLTDTRVDIALTTMETNHLVTRYTIQGVMVVQFLDWDIHQTFKGFKRKPSHFPPEPKTTTITQTGDNHPTLPVKETKLKETNINKTKHLDFVFLTIEEFGKLKEKFGEDKASGYIERLNNYIGQIGIKAAGKKYISHFHVILNWANKDGESKNGKTENSTRIRS